MSRLLALIAGTVAVTLLAHLGPVAEAATDDAVTVHGRIASFDTGHAHSFLLRTRHHGFVEVFVGADTRVAIDDHIARPSELEVGMRARIAGVLVVTDDHRPVIRARVVRAFTPPAHD